MTANVLGKTKIYYDGLCHLCSREIDHYKKMRGASNIEFIDITAHSFSAASEGVDPVEIHKSIHVRDKWGHIQTGVDAFITIWNELPALKFIVPIAKAKPIHLVLEALYGIFAKVRPLLPKKSCENSPYCETHTKR